MKLEVRLFATFRDGREKKYFLDLNEDTTPRDIVNMLKIDEEEVAILLINGRDGKLDTILKDNDVLSLFPPVGGG
ncbi:MoaD/ThiS family protein [Clostridium magnum]|uniref:ThiS family protein n=1 Tax=Clostridium magnum DSM 2767 TaxID=1121326 RepID=A0A161WV03_9CLOT|nr:MoaD/ThiS family protein [Clostridium magnum]KZL90708.1 ThiS family protein [Clostridium magnum DSM 2767]SHI41184.1 Molybdopterin converting factor, small subunit [Clostridium magnum DSM 2767]